MENAVSEELDRSTHDSEVGGLLVSVNRPPAARSRRFGTLRPGLLSAPSQSCARNHLCRVRKRLR
jgi:hypothetical protein